MITYIVLIKSLNPNWLFYIEYGVKKSNSYIKKIYTLYKHCLAVSTNKCFLASGHALLICEICLLDHNQHFIKLNGPEKEYQLFLNNSYYWLLKISVYIYIPTHIANFISLCLLRRFVFGNGP